MHISAKCSIAIHCLVFIYEYGETQKVTSSLLALSTGVNPVMIRNILSSLKKDGMVSVRFGTVGAMIQCPLEEITIYRICRAVEPDFLSKLFGTHSLPSQLCPVGKNIHNVLGCSYGKIQEDLCKSMKSITMKDVVADHHSFQENKTARN